MLLSALPRAMIPYDKCGCMRAKNRVLRLSKGNNNIICFTCFIEINALDTFLFISFICIFRVRFPSRCIPWNLEDISRQSFPIRESCVFTIWILYLGRSSLMCLGRRTIYLVLLAFRDNLCTCISCSHLTTLFGFFNVIYVIVILCKATSLSILFDSSEHQLHVWKSSCSLHVNFIWG